MIKIFAPEEEFLLARTVIVVFLLGFPYPFATEEAQMQRIIPHQKQSSNGFEDIRLIDQQVNTFLAPEVNPIVSYTIQQITPFTKGYLVSFHSCLKHPFFSG
ncbi:hypothetical protein M5689_018620 [Euphorbia peplus]|nr:hypothetical protein M5689_018620 [Euphorbia peplus]